MDSHRDLSSSFTIKRVEDDLYVVSIPVFNIGDGWAAIKIAYKKLNRINGEHLKSIKLVNCNQITPKNFKCEFSFKSKLSKDELTKKIRWSVYRIVSRR